ncbi:MAG: DNA gyrase inhibitor YacG [Geminicoccaceae bacterium]|nr:DNA gyrase inhibitor YacG [Geminicoccaceae bacterium]
MSEGTTGKKAVKPAPRCPTCGKPAVPDFKPFCSARCRDVDLGRWLEGAYAIPAVEADEDEDDEGRY